MLKTGACGFGIRLSSRLIWWLKMFVTPSSVSTDRSDICKFHQMTYYQIAQDKVSHDHMDDEIVAIHFDTGVYYSLRDTAIQLWKAMEQPVTIDALASRFDSLSVADRDALQAFLDELVAEGLLNRLEQADAAREDGETWGPYTQPVMEKYTDMKELLLADPIHDVDADEGWPRLKPDQHG